MIAVRFTAQDLKNFPEDGKRREVIQGELIVSPAPNTRHQMILKNLARLVDAFILAFPRGQRPGQTFFSPTDVTLGDEGVQPDFLFVSQDRYGLITKQEIGGPPDWIVEVISPSSRTYDLETKRKLYQRAGVIAYWVIDPELEQVHTWDWQTNTSSLAKVGDTLEVSVLVGFKLEVEAVFETLT
jgi:Uma2 family endonuclease